MINNLKPALNLVKPIIVVKNSSNAIYNEQDSRWELITFTWFVFKNSSNQFTKDAFLKIKVAEIMGESAITIISIGKIS